MPIIADESIFTCNELERIGQYFQGVNIKTSAAGSEREFQQMVELSRAMGLKLVLGCNYNTELSFVPMLDLLGSAYAFEFDAPILVTNDPFRGICPTGLWWVGGRRRSPATLPKQCYFKYRRLLWEKEFC